MAVLKDVCSVSLVLSLLQAHMEAVHADWKEYLNLLICEENHLKHMDEYHKVRDGELVVYAVTDAHTHAHTHTNS